VLPVVPLTVKLALLICTGVPVAPMSPLLVSIFTDEAVSTSALAPWVIAPLPAVPVPVVIVAAPVILSTELSATPPAADPFAALPVVTVNGPADVRLPLIDMAPEAPVVAFAVVSVIPVVFVAVIVPLTVNAPEVVPDVSAFSATEPADTAPLDVRPPAVFTVKVPAPKLEAAIVTVPVLVSVRVTELPAARLEFAEIVEASVAAALSEPVPEERARLLVLIVPVSVTAPLPLAVSVTVVALLPAPARPLMVPVTVTAVLAPVPVRVILPPLSVAPLASVRLAPESLTWKVLPWFVPTRDAVLESLR